MSITIEKRKNRNKELLLENLKTTPIVQIVCQKIGVARATYYRWRHNDHEFAKQADTALEEGSLLINDLAESQLISAIKDQNLGAIIFWLKSHHPAYTNKVEVTGQLKHEYKLSDEEEKLIEQALMVFNKD
jgi:hypothetical protein